MIRILDSEKKNFHFSLENIIERRKKKASHNLKIVRKIVNDIKKNKDKALIKYEKKFNKNNSIFPKQKKIKEAIRKLDVKVKRAIDIAYNRIYKWHSMQKVKNLNYTDHLGNNLKYKYIPIESVAVYVPGSSVSYPSSLLMGAIPAIIAGVKRIIVINPGKNSNHNPAVLYAAQKCKIKEIYSIGGAQGIAAVSFGTKKIKKVDKVVGPGSSWVTLAKKEVSDIVGIDGLHGPSEILIVADKYSNPEWVAADLLAQSEHSQDSMSILLSKDKKFINKVKVSIKNQIRKLKRKSIAGKSLATNGVIVYIPSDKKIIELVNKIGPEHLSVSTSNYKKILPKIKNAGSIACGPGAIMALTDYLSGSNHILPTEGKSYYSSGLNVFEFYKKISIVNHSKEGVETLGRQAITLAQYEELEAHAESIKLRTRRK